MFNLIISMKGTINEVTGYRILETGFTDEKNKRRFSKHDGKPDFDKLAKLPTVLVAEYDQHPEVPVQIGFLQPPEFKVLDRSVYIPVFNASVLQAHPDLFGIKTGESSDTHWAVKDGSLFQKLNTLFKSNPELLQPPTTTLTEVDPHKIAVMMPFKTEFHDAYDAIKQACQDEGFESVRVDELHDPVDISQQVLDLIRSSKYVIVDTSGHNPNVFFETGFAVGIGKKYIPLTSTPELRMPFDIQNTRFIKYDNDQDGRNRLKADLSKTLQTLKQ